MIQDLRTATDVTNVRKKLLEEQQGKDACTGLPIPEGQAVLDHAHDENQYVRGVLHRQTNAAIGKIENFYSRLLAFWYPGTISDFLRQAADYLEKEHDTRYRHPGWLKKATAMFNKLSADKQKAVLLALGANVGDTKNLKERKLLFIKTIRQRTLSADTILLLLKEQ